MTHQNERPVFLTVLCIISFVGLGLAVLEALGGLVMGPFIKSIAGVAEVGMDEALDEVSNDAPQILPLIEGIFGGVVGILEHLTEISLVNLFCSLIALFGVIMMWKLKKTGYYLYIAGKVIIAVFPLILIGSNFITGITSVLGIFFAAIFIVLYGLNLKAMN